MIKPLWVRHTENEHVSYYRFTDEMLGLLAILCGNVVAVRVKCPPGFQRGQLRSRMVFCKHLDEIADRDGSVCIGESFNDFMRCMSTYKHTVIADEREGGRDGYRETNQQRAALRTVENAHRCLGAFDAGSLPACEYPCFFIVKNQ